MTHFKGKKLLVKDMGLLDVIFLLTLESTT